MANVKNKTVVDVRKPKEKFLSGKIVNPKRDWIILVILFVVLILSSIGFDADMYLKIVSGDMYVSVTRADLVIENLKTDALQKIVNNFAEKKTNMINLKLVNLVDPSI